MHPASELPRLNLFVSYSRDDHAFADQLVAALETSGFATTIDRTGIHGAENWQQRLGQLILESDTVVFVLTPASAASAVCAWEVEHALELKKRIVPIVASALGTAEPHRSLRDLNYIYFYDEPKVPGSGFGRGLAQLAAALSVDVEWIRKHTRLNELAISWGRDRTADLLLQGSQLVAAQEWRDARPANAPALTAQQEEFLRVSEDAEQERTSEKRRRLEERQRVLAERSAALDKLTRRTRFYYAARGITGIMPSPRLCRPHPGRPRKPAERKGSFLCSSPRSARHNPAPSLRPPSGGQATESPASCAPPEIGVSSPPGH